MSFGGKVRIPNLSHFFMFLTSSELYVAAYWLGGFQALFVGICDGVYARKFKTVPVWLPLAAALFAFMMFFVTMGGVHSVSKMALPIGIALINISPLLLTHLFAAVAVWYLIKLIYRPVQND
jgi:hypothetical protein